MPKLIHRLLNRSGQHTIEYSVILILVMSGIIIGTPYVIRSWNANMQGWEDSVMDSYNDPLMQAPNVVSLPGCTCTWDVGVGCGPIGGCAETELADQCLCTPVGCGLSNPFSACPEQTFRCACNAACCSTPTFTGLCGGAGGCSTGEGQFVYYCGCSTTPIFTCLPESACTFDCYPPITQPPNSQACPNRGDSSTGCLTQNRLNILVDTCTGGCDHCEFECVSPYFPVAGYTMCGTCGPGTVAQGACTAGQCEQTSACSGGQCPSS